MPRYLSRRVGTHNGVGGGGGGGVRKGTRGGVLLALVAYRVSVFPWGSPPFQRSLFLFHFFASFSTNPYLVSLRL